MSIREKAHQFNGMITNSKLTMSPLNDIDVPEAGENQLVSIKMRQKLKTSLFN